MKKPTKGGRASLSGPSQRQLRAGELVRHAIVQLLREEPLQDPVLQSASVTVTEARMSSDLRHAFVFVEPLGGHGSAGVVDALNRHAKFLRGHLGRRVDLKFTPDLVFRHDETFEAAARMDELFKNPKIQADLEPPVDSPADLAAQAREEENKADDDGA